MYLAEEIDRMMHRFQMDGQPTRPRDFEYSRKQTAKVRDQVSSEIHSID